MKIAGKLASASRVLGTARRMFTFHLNSLAASVRQKNHHVKWSAGAATEIAFWLKNFDGLNSAEIWPNSRWEPCHFTLRCDAGEPGWGMYVDHGRPQDEEPPPEDIAHGYWQGRQRKKSSTWRELRGFLLGFLAIVVPRFSGRRVLIYVDAKNLETIWKSGGSKKPEHHAMLVELYWAAKEAGIQLEIHWIPREENTRADEISKIFDTSDWKINPRLFRALARKWGEPRVDLFATAENKLCNRFYSRYWSLGTMGVDAFARDWGEIPLCWCNPPFELIGRVLIHAKLCKARMILVVPEWFGQAWWPLLRGPRGRGWAPFITDSHQLPSGRDTFLPGAAGGNRIGVGAAKYICWALLCDFALD